MLSRSCSDRQPFSRFLASCLTCGSSEINGRQKVGKLTQHPGKELISELKKVFLLIVQLCWLPLEDASVMWV